MNLTPGFGAMQELRRRPFRLHLAEPYKFALYGMIALVIVAAIGHFH